MGEETGDQDWSLRLLVERDKKDRDSRKKLRKLEKKKEDIGKGSQEPRRRAKKLKFSRIEEGDCGEDNIPADALSFLYTGLEQHSM